MLVEFDGFLEWGRGDGRVGGEEEWDWSFETCLRGVFSINFEVMVCVA